MHLHRHAHVLVGTHTDVHASQRHTEEHTHTHRHTYRCACSQTQKHTQVHIYRHMHKFACSQHTNVHRYNTSVHVHTHTRIGTHTGVHAHQHKSTHIQIRRHTHICAHTSSSKAGTRLSRSLDLTHGYDSELLDCKMWQQGALWYGASLCHVRSTTIWNVFNYLNESQWRVHHWWPEAELCAHWCTWVWFSTLVLTTWGHHVAMATWLLSSAHLFLGHR